MEKLTKENVDQINKLLTDIKESVATLNNESSNLQGYIDILGEAWDDGIQGSAAKLKDEIQELKTNLDDKKNKIGGEDNENSLVKTIEKYTKKLAEAGNAETNNGGAA